MSETEIRFANESTPIEQALRTMESTGVRRLLVTGDERKMVGLLSVDEVLQLLTGEAAAEPGGRSQPASGGAVNRML